MPTPEVPSFNLYQYKGIVVAVYDGDTITVRIDVGFKIGFEEKIRLFGINAPELRGVERPQGLITRDRLRELILDKEVYIETIKDKKGKYGRYLGVIYTVSEEETVNINSQLVAEGLAVFAEY